MKHACSLLICVSLLGPTAVGIAADSTAATAEVAWTNLVAAEEKLNEASPPSLDGPQFERFLTEHSRRAGELADRFKLYEQEYAGSPHALAAWDKWMDLLVQSAYKLPERRSELEKAEQQCLADPKLSGRQRETILNNQVDRCGDPEEQEKLVRRAMTEVESPTEFFCRHMLSIAEFSEHAHASAIVEEILSLKDGVETPEWYSNHVTAPHTVSGWLAGEKGILQYCQAQAQELKKTLDRIGHPVQLKFTAFDGTIVDLQRLRGKVVLLEFWATWCPPCVAGIPRVRAAWDALHEKGLEVVALSYDTDRETLKQFLEKHRLPWPQFFDPQGKESTLIRSFGQPGPPAYWLIDRQGVLADVNAHEALQEKVKRLLASKETGSKR